ncbi:MAG: SurA N-terminal domain-containing protein [Acidobacteria bacterium]|nr:SurA N-terminal domain-containing protein [Acidobacteriota bacterium]MCW5971257.1 SurA N-terminal domain-containing protein [Blastocatellales bacterium]
MRKLLTPICFLLLTSIMAACGGSGASSSPDAGKDETAAVVNSVRISVADVDRVTAQQLRGQEAELSQLELASARLQALDGLITQEVLFQRAQKDNLIPSEDDVTQEIQRLKQEGGLTEEAFQKQLKEANQNEAQFRDSVRKNLAIQKLRDKLTAQLKVQDREVEDFFRANPKEFVARRGVALSAIVVDPADNGARFDAKGELEAEQKIKEIHTRLKSGSDFATIARQQSEDDSAYRSGDLGFIAEEQFPALAQQGLPAGLGPRLMGMKEGDITEPVRAQSGRWYIFKLTQKRTESRELTLNDPEVRKQISDFVLKERGQLVNAALLTRARDEAKIENFLAMRMLENPNSFGILRPVSQASPAASPAASPTANQ